MQQVIARYLFDQFKADFNVKCKLKSWGDAVETKPHGNTSIDNLGKAEEKSEEKITV